MHRSFSEENLNHVQKMVYMSDFVSKEDEENITL